MITEVLASLAMMFSVLTREQLWFERTINYSLLKVMNGEAVSEKTVEYPEDWNFFGDAEWLSEDSADADSVPDFSFLDEEDIPLPDGLENPEYGPQSEAPESAAEVLFRNSNQRLKLFEYGEEQLTLNSSSDGQIVLSVNANTVRRLTYDRSWRQIEKLVLKNSTSFADVKLLSKTTYRYKESVLETGDTDGNGAVQNSAEETRAEDKTPPSFEKPEFMREELFSQKKIIETDFNEEGKPLKVRVYSTEGEEQKLVRVTVRKYDDENRIVSEQETSYYEESTETKRNEFTYTDVSEIPDLKFYENGKLRLEDKYLSESSYEETLYFDNDIRVRVKYEHGRKIREIITSGDTEISRRNFD